VLNPFYHRQRIADPRCFYGRGELVRGLLEMVASGQSCAVIGERRIGKSSLLAFLSDSQVLANHGLDTTRTVTATLDFLALNAYSVAELWREILETIEPGLKSEEGRKLVSRPLSQAEISFADIRRTIRALNRFDTRIVLLCDELELAVQNPELDESFFGALRSLASIGVVFVTASRLSLLELDQYTSEETRMKVLGSPFFNIFAEFPLGPFEDHEVAEMLAGSLEQTPIQLSDHDLALLDRIAGRHPYFLQLTAFHLFNQLQQGQDAQHSATQRLVIEKVRLEAAKIFRNLWQNSRQAERKALTVLASGRTGADPQTLIHLQQRGLVRQVGKTPAGENSSYRYQLFSELFTEWIAAELGIPVPAPEIASKDEVKIAELDIQADVSMLPTDRYSIVEEIGRGGAGTVFKAWDEKLRRIVAVKVLHKEVRAARERMEHLLNEARTCAGLNHPHIIVIYDIDIDNGYLVEELLAGGSLRDLLEMTSTLLVPDVLRMAEQLADALVAAHGTGVIHRDLKPENVLLTQSPRFQDGTAMSLPPIKLTDFGTALRMDELARSRERRSTAGTLAYMSPEQLYGGDTSPMSDIYSLGVILYEAIHGQRPAPAGADQSEPASEALEAKPSSELDAIITRCLEQDPKDRFTSAEELLSAVKRAGQAFL
jgi:tRNA A-37 threonylcarbamoyl transferase component Bud32